MFSYSSAVRINKTKLNHVKKSNQKHYLQMSVKGKRVFLKGCNKYFCFYISLHWESMVSKFMSSPNLEQGKIRLFVLNCCCEFKLMQKTSDWRTEQLGKLRNVCLPLLATAFSDPASHHSRSWDVNYIYWSSQAIKRTSREDERTIQDESLVFKF